MKKTLLCGLLTAGMMLVNNNGVQAAGSKMYVLTKVQYDQNYLFQGKASTSYGYNAKGLVTRETDKWPKSIMSGTYSYVYNGANRIVKLSGGTKLTYKGNKLVKIGDKKLTYNKKGQLIKAGHDPETKFTYNKKGQLWKAQYVNGFEIFPTYEYDGKGQLKTFRMDGPNGEKGDVITYKNVYRGSLLVKQNYTYKKEGKKNALKGTITYYYKKVNVPYALKKRVLAQQSALHYAGNGDYYGMYWTNYFFYMA